VCVCGGGGCMCLRARVYLIMCIRVCERVFMARLMNVKYLHFRCLCH
jgi:hypothetical protein